MYPSRDAITKANMTDDIPPHALSNFNSMKHQLRPGQSRPLSSHFNQMLLIKDPSAQQMIKSADKLGKAKQIDARK